MWCGGIVSLSIEALISVVNALAALSKLDDSKLIDTDSSATVTATLIATNTNSNTNNSGSNATTGGSGSGSSKDDDKKTSEEEEKDMVCISRTVLFFFAVRRSQRVLCCAVLFRCGVLFVCLTVSVALISERVKTLQYSIESGESGVQRHCQHRVGTDTDSTAISTVQIQ